ncbi:MAG: phage tail protein, partial [Shinella sp.]
GLTNGDFNSIIVPGLYSTGGTWINGPLGTATHAGLLEVQARYYANFYVQILRLSNGQVFRRTGASASSWDPWVVIELPAVGTVSRAGGLPAGALIERGNNSNGEYVRFADGTQICISPAISDISVTTAFGSAMFSSPLVSDTPFPAAFVGSPMCFGMNNSQNNVFFIVRGSTTNWIWLAAAPVSLTGRTARLCAIGRWFS